VPVVVVLGLASWLEPEPLARPDGGRLYPVRAVLAERLASLAGVAVDVVPAGPRDTADGLADGAVAALGAGARLIDRGPDEVGGEPAVRTLVLADAAGIAVVVEQWWLVAAGSRVVLTATADLASWAALAGDLRQAVAGATLGAVA